MDVNALRGKIVAKGLNVEKLAEMIGVDRSSLYRKMNNAERITIGEAEKIRTALDMTKQEATDIFFA